MLEVGAILSFGDYSKYFSAVSARNATDKLPMYEMPLIFVFWGWGEHVSRHYFPKMPHHSLLSGAATALS